MSKAMEALQSSDALRTVERGPANGTMVVGAKEFVQKRYSMRQLLTKIREILDKN